MLKITKVRKNPHSRRHSIHIILIHLITENHWEIILLHQRNFISLLRLWYVCRVVFSGLFQLMLELIKNYSYNVVWQKPICLLFIDGLHDYPNVARDFWHFSKWVCTGGYVAFHDYSDYYPGVRTFVDELLFSGTYRKINLADSLMVVQKSESQ